MGIPAYRPGGDDVGSENAGSGDHSGGEGSASGADTSGAADDDMGDVGTMGRPLVRVQAQMTQTQQQLLKTSRTWALLMPLVKLRLMRRLLEQNLKRL